jgi:hypothetical protein
MSPTGSPANQLGQSRDRLERFWFYGTFLYCLAVAGVAGLSSAHDGGGGPMAPLIRVLFAPAMLSFGVLAIYAGELRARWGTRIAREGNPIAFWVMVGVYLALSCYLSFSGLSVALR